MNIIIIVLLVVFKVIKIDGEVLYIDNFIKLLLLNEIVKMEELMVKVIIMVFNEFVGSVMELCQERRGIFKDMLYIEIICVIFIYEMFFMEIVYDFFDVLKLRLKGYVLFDYEFIGYVELKFVKFDIMIKGEVVDVFLFIVYKDKVY